MRPGDGLSREEQDQLDEVRIACDLARVFAGLVRDWRGHLLADLVRKAEINGSGPVRGFAGFLRQDWDAVLAGMTLDYSSGVVEEHVVLLARLYPRRDVPSVGADVTGARRGRRIGETPAEYRPLVRLGNTRPRPSLRPPTWQLG
jgi:hypothetical protein